MTHQTTPVRDQLKAVGLRITAPRAAVLEWLAGHPHSTVDQVAAGVRDVLGSVSTQTVYDVLGACANVDLVRRVEPAGHPARFETRTGDNHHHLVCRGCGRAEDVDCVHGAAPCLEPSNTAGFVVEEAEVVFWGLCPACSTTHHEKEGSA
ncbi:Fur family transcriptional regulator [Amycolatopsis methanolica]|uniref:Fe2+/Zn2+ uptake regulation protein n=1 Tax=Amycolatopsis methanolica 239 TaxID=1068978 RepID=A0A076MZJ6_AMYME|nr:Fur family transcriptional regulator [Amycolatopsis methanolica]AIJ26754.1 Fe2+/Zn2+ uptake regulation protein [Amycolatopsis methanolica 239]